MRAAATRQKAATRRALEQGTELPLGVQQAVMRGEVTVGRLAEIAKPRPPQRPGGSGLDEVDEAERYEQERLKQQRQEAEEKMEHDKAEATARLWAAIPEELRDTDEARLMVSRVQTSWMSPIAPAVAQRWQREWVDFVASTPLGKAESAARSGLFVPGVSDRPQGKPSSSLWRP